MAQELADKIRAAAQAKNIDPEVALAIARAESSLRPDAKASTSSAGGLFQVVDKTWREFGGNPKKKLDPDENIRVGTDIIAKNTQTLKAFLNRDPRPAEIYAAHYFGPSGAKSFLSADPATPIVDILGKQAVKANPNLQGKNVGQVLAQLETKMGGPKRPDVSRETPAPVPRETLPPSLPPMAEAAPAPSKMASLGPSYQAALALSFLADTDEKEDRDVDREPGIAEKWLAEQAPRPSALAQFADLSIKSPFAALEPQQPQMLADGGEIKESLSDRVLKAVVPMDLRILGSTLMGNRDPITESNFRPEELAAMQQAVDRAAARTGKTQKGSVQYVDYPRGEEIGPGFQPVGQTLGRFVYEKSPTGQTIITDKYDFYNEGRKANVEKYEKMGRAEKALSVSGNMLKNLVTGNLRQIPGELADAYIGRDGREVRIQLPVKRSEGGEAEPTAEEIAAASRPATVNPNIRRQGEAARRLAALRDVNTLPDPRTYAAVSGFLGQAPDELGFSVMHPDAEGIKRAGQAGFGVGTALQVAPMMGALRAAGVGPSSAGRPASAASQLGAVRMRGTPFMMERGILTPGGEFEPIDQAENYVRRTLATTQDAKLNDWFSTRMLNYLRRDFASPEDQFVKAAEEGKLLHLAKKPTKRDQEDVLDFSQREGLKYTRETEGFPPQGLATTPYGQRVESLTDVSVNPATLEDLLPYQVPPGMRARVETDPSARVSDLASFPEETLQLRALRDDMLRMRQMGPEFSRYNQPPVKVPKEYMLTDESLVGLTPAQASNRVAQFRNWEQATKEKMASNAAFNDPSLSRTPSSKGHVWINPPDLEANPALRELIQDVGCDGGWCTKGETHALSAGSGENRLTVLMDSKARPQAQMTITARQYGPDDFISSLDDSEFEAFRANYPDIALYETDAIARTPEFRQWQAMNPDSVSISEIKGVNNLTDLKNVPYVKQIQERVKDLDARFGLQQVENLDGIGMTDLTSKFSGHPALADRSGVTRDAMRAINQEAARLNGGSRFVENDKAVIDSLIEQAADNILGPQKRATGGMVERRMDHRKYL